MMNQFISKLKNTELGKTWYQASILIAVTAGIFSLIACILIILNYTQLSLSDPLNSADLAELKVALSQQSGDEAIKEQIRKLDFQLRKEYFRHREFSKIGGYLLIVNVTIFLISIKSVMSYQKKIPMPEVTTIVKSNSSSTRWIIALLGLLISGTAIALMLNTERGLTPQFLETAKQIAMEYKAKSQELTTESALQTQQVAQENVVSKVGTTENLGTTSQVINTQIAPTADYPSLEDMKKNWPRFRGPEGLGISYYNNIPSSWNGKTGEGILWKTPVPLPGENSPVVWGNKVFLTGATESKREVYCFDTNSGKMLWQKSVENVPGSSLQPPKVSEDTGYAAPTSATDGKRVYAIFANGDVICFDFDGNQIWSRNLGNPNSVYGYASSLCLFKNLLIIQFDQGGADDNLSKLIALDIASGQPVWQTSRPVPNSWSSPIVINTGNRHEIITTANPYVIAYEPDTGKELWRAKCLSGDIAPSPIYANGLVFAVNTYAKLAAIKPGGQGDVTGTNIIWTATDGLPDICSPLSNGELLFLLQTYGLMTCYDTKDGKKVWENDLAETFKSSPSLVGDKIYLMTENGLMIIIKADREFKEVGRCELGEKSNTTPAFVDGCIYIRGEKNLYCIK